MDKLYVINKTVELMREFNPSTHSIDTFCLEKLGPTLAIAPGNIEVKTIPQFELI